MAKQVDALAGRKILVVEDEYLLADEVRKALMAAGANVVGPFGDIAAGLAALESSPDLSGAVLDVNLRDEPIFPLADALRGRDIPFVFTTGYDKASIPAAYRHVSRCEKPIDAAELLRLVAAL